MRYFWDIRYTYYYHPLYYKALYIVLAFAFTMNYSLYIDILKIIFTWQTLLDLVNLAYIYNKRYQLSIDSSFDKCKLDTHIENIKYNF